MAKMQVYLLAAVLLASSAVEVFGRGGGHVVPHNIVRKDVKIPDKVKVGLNKSPNFAKTTDSIHGSQKGHGSGNAHLEHDAYGVRNSHLTHTQGSAEAKKLETEGGGHGEATLNVNAGGFTNFGNVKSGGVIKGTSRSVDDGKAKVEKLKAVGTATDGQNLDSSSGEVDIKQNQADGKNHGEARNTADAAAGGKVAGKTVSGIKGRAVDNAFDNADSDTDVNGNTFGDNRRHGKDVSYATGHTDTDSDTSDRHTSADGFGELHGGSEAGKTYATVEVKGTSQSKNLGTNKRSEAEGRGDATAHSTEFPSGATESYADSSAKADGKILDRKGGAKGTGKGIGNSGVEHKTEAFSKTDASFNTGVTNHGPKDTNAKASGKHVAALKGGKGSVSAGGESNVHISKGDASSTADGDAHAVKDAGR